MAEQLVLIETTEKRRRPASRYRTGRASQTQGRSEWHLDRRTVAVGRRGLEEARRALRRASQSAA